MMSRGLKYLTRASGLILVLSIAVEARMSTQVPSSATATRPATIEQPGTAATIKRYCQGCHNERLKANYAGLSFDALDSSRPWERPDVWEKVIAKLRAGSMPPPGLPRPDDGAYQALLQWFETAIDQKWAEAPNPGRTESLHRLNRAEYQNAIRDLLGLEGIDVSTLLPSDDASYGFDNMAGALGLSPTHIERYLSVARKISRTAVGDVTAAPSSVKYRLTEDLSQDDRIDSLPFGTRGGLLVRHYFPVDAEYEFQILTVAGYESSLKEENQIEVTVNGERVLFTAVEQKINRQADDASTQLSIRLPMVSGLHEIGVTFVQKTSAQAETLLQPFLRPPGVSAVSHFRLGGYSGPYVAWLSVAGPFNAAGAGDSPSRRRIFGCHPSNPSLEIECARTILTKLARRGYRRPATPADVNRLLSFYREGRARGSFDQGIQFALQRLLVDPDFLFRVERDPGNLSPGTAYALGDIELASRLSFFLWSSIPDDELLELAETRQLRNPLVLEQQVRRMLRDHRSDALVKNFFGQWLRLRNLDGVVRETRMFPDFDENLRQSFRRETELFIGSILKEDRPLSTLLDADYTFVNERLARHYGISGVYGTHFRRIALGSDSPRRGLLGHGSILTVTSHPNRTSPVIRGKFLLDNVLGAPPPPPPPDVPDLKDKNQLGKPLTMKAAMEQHRANPVCASCHRPMDPLGFALENFDAVGAWRVQDAGVSVDAQGALPDGTKFEGVTGLRQALLTRTDLFVNTLAEKMLAYALGRGVEYYDRPALRAMTGQARAKNYRFSELLVAIVKSVPFQMRSTAYPSERSADGKAADAQ